MQNIFPEILYYYIICKFKKINNSTPNQTLNFFQQVSDERI